MSAMEVPVTGTAAGVAPQPVPQLQRNPQLPQHPLGAYTDAQYEAQSAALKSDIAKKYADVLQQLGYIDPTTGQFIQGSVETEANRQRGLLNRQLGLAREDVTHQHQQNGTLFSGLRGDDQARAEFPYTDQLGQIETQTPLTLSGLYERAGGLMSDYTIGDNQLLADAAARRAAGLATTGADGTAGTSTANATDAAANSTPDTSVAPPPAPPGGTYNGIAVPNMNDAFSGWGSPGAAPGPQASTTFAPVGVDWTAANAIGAAPAPASDYMAGAAPAPAVIPPPLPVATTTPTTPAAGDTSGISSAAKRKLMQWG